jgi:RNA polymerase sigma factor (sigma-70 family)
MRTSDDDPPSSDGRRSDASSDAPDDEENAPQSGTGPSSAKVIPLHRASMDARRALLARADMRDMVRAIVATRVPSQHVEDIVQDANEEALRALERTPPSRDEALPAWLAQIARRVAADFLAQRARRSKYEGPMPEEPAEAHWGDAESGQSERPHRAPEPSHDPRIDDAAELHPWLARRWLEHEVAGDPRDKETFEIVFEHAQGEKTYQQIAAERGMTVTALSSRIFEFKQAYIPRYKRWRNRAIIVILLGAAAVLVAAVVLWRLLQRPDSIGPDPSIAPPPQLPIPSASASAPEPFEPALPTRPLPPDKPLPDKPAPRKP